MGLGFWGFGVLQVQGFGVQGLGFWGVGVLGFICVFRLGSSSLKVLIMIVNRL